MNALIHERLGIPKLKARMAEVLIKFEVDQNGILVITETKTITNTIDLHGKHLPKDFQEMVDRAKHLENIDDEIKIIQTKCTELEKLCQQAENAGLSDNIPGFQDTIDGAIDLVARAQKEMVCGEELEETMKKVKELLHSSPRTISVCEEKTEDAPQAKKLKMDETFI